MESVHRFVTPPSKCGYLPDRHWSLEYEWVAAMTPAEYQDRLDLGWRRFGHALFHPRCPRCTACRSLRVKADLFQPDRSQRRARRANESETILCIGAPDLSCERLELYRRYHEFQARHKGWPEERAANVEAYVDAFLLNPIPTEEWCYYRSGRLIGVGYVDALPKGLSAIYFFHDPDFRRLSLGTWNILRLIEEAQRRRLPFVYLGYYVEGSASMTYKARFVPNQLLETDGLWHDFQPSRK